MSPRNDLRSDLTADLLADLGRPAPLPASIPLSPLPDLPVGGGTPAVAVTLTPLRWSRPCLTTPERGHGVAVRIGPWRVEVVF